MLSAGDVAHPPDAIGAFVLKRNGPVMPSSPRASPPGLGRPASPPSRALPLLDGCSGGRTKYSLLCARRGWAFLKVHIDDLIGDLTNTLTEAMSVLIEQLERITEFLVCGREESLDLFRVVIVSSVR
jgi:hypothetical protein